jgi:hypothetical protein
MRLFGLSFVFLLLIVLQAMLLTEGFGASQGGAQIQLAASRPVWYVAAVPAA